MTNNINPIYHIKFNLSNNSPYPNPYNANNAGFVYPWIKSPI